ncbi:MAG: hypothetical protein ACPGWR_22805 [Ardenticatenaceae bacterium]
MTSFPLAINLLSLMIVINVSVVLIGYLISKIIYNPEEAKVYHRQYIRTLKSERRAWLYQASTQNVLFLDG